MQIWFGGCFLFCFWDRVVLCCQGWSQSLNRPASASWVPGLQASAYQVISRLFHPSIHPSIHPSTHSLIHSSW
jgi:hypothetical protein